LELQVWEEVEEQKWQTYFENDKRKSGTLIKMEK
jgi:hypothetical protein